MMINNEVYRHETLHEGKLCSYFKIREKNSSVNFSGLNGPLDLDFFVGSPSSCCHFSDLDGREALRKARELTEVCSDRCLCPGQCPSTTPRVITRPDYCLGTKVTLVPENPA